MKVTNLSRKQYKSLIGLEVAKEVYNTEAELKEITIKGQRKVIKELYVQEGELFANKLYTLEMLDTNAQYIPETLHIPDTLAIYNGEVIGFTLDFVEGINLTTVLRSKEFTFDDHIFYLRKIGELLDKLKTMRKYTPLKDFYLNDLHDSNFIVNTRTKSLEGIDLDSCKIANNVSFPARFLTPFSLLNNVNGKYRINKEEYGSGYVIADENSDIYCYIMIILNYLFGSNLGGMSIEDFYTYLNYLDRIGINQELLNIIEKIVINCPNINPEPYLETLTSENIIRARENIYKLTKNKILK